MLRDVLIKNHPLPLDWSISSIGKNATVQTGPFGSQLHEEDYVLEDGIPIITVEHMFGRYIRHKNLPLVSADDTSRLSKYSLLTGDIVFSRVGSVDRAVMVSKNENGWLFSGRCLRVRPLVQSHATFFLWWFGQDLIKQLIVAAAVGATMPSINTTILSEIPVIMPPQDVFEKFDVLANRLLDLVFDNNSEIKALEETNEAMLVRLAKIDL
ncbi:MAG: restriction endonuclease subunit S [Deltaproteobacteria bacterium]|nr:restriction endonuclease subunit S [Deltaproteobacteria bacterium]